MPDAPEVPPKLDDESNIPRQDGAPKGLEDEPTENNESVVEQNQNTQLTSPDMEVHHHTHTERKQFRHYAFEFFMLFFAVFCGFIADYLLEERIERHREHQYIESLVRDLVMDSINMDLCKKYNDTLVTSFDTLLGIIKRGHLVDSSFLCYQHYLYTTDYFIFFPTERTVKQLQYAGGMRLVHDIKASDTIMLRVKGTQNSRIMFHLHLFPPRKLM